MAERAAATRLTNSLVQAAIYQRIQIDVSNWM
jgi:hypothetical protein